MTLDRCLYQIFGGYASWQERHIYRCPNCLPDSRNLQCKYYKPVRLWIIDTTGGDPPRQ